MNTIKSFFFLIIMSFLLLIAGAAIGGETVIIFALIFAIAMTFGAYWFSDKIALKMAHATQIQRESSPELFDLVENQATRAELPMPKVYLIETEIPNAFATGRNPANATVAVTAGAIKLLDQRELGAVLAHEMAHVKNRDTLVMCVAAVIAGFISFAARMMWWNSMFGGRNRNVHPGIMILVVITAPLAAVLLQMAVSRSREYHADGPAAKLTNKPWALVSALKKLEWENHRKPLDCGSPSNAALCIANPLRVCDFFVNMFSTHPPMEKRIKALEKL